jgi:hypothetical protein
MTEVRRRAGHRARRSKAGAAADPTSGYFLIYAAAHLLAIRVMRHHLKTAEDEDELEDEYDKANKLSFSSSFSYSPSRTQSIFNS